jgi:hypothetical protein
MFGTVPAGTTPLSNCLKGALYMLWGATLQAAYTSWGSFCGSGCTITCVTDGNIRTAVTAWITSPTTAAATYGSIGDWDVSGLSNMAALFYPSVIARPTLNDDISKWNTASVSTMYQACPLPRCRISLLPNSAAGFGCELRQSSLGTRVLCGVWSARKRIHLDPCAGLARFSLVSTSSILHRIGPVHLACIVAASTAWPLSMINITCCAKY